MIKYVNECYLMLTNDARNILTHNFYSISIIYFQTYKIKSFLSKSSFYPVSLLVDLTKLFQTCLIF